MRIEPILHAKALRNSIPSHLPMQAALGLAISLAACAAHPKPPIDESVFASRPAQALEVSLEFGTVADLDLHVTAPDLETIYFGNSPGRGGGRLDRDVRCEDGDRAQARVETIRFDAPQSGRYRVGIDHVKACRRLRKDAKYSIRVRGPGLDLVVDGEIGGGHFDNTALEFDWPETEGPR